MAQNRTKYLVSDMKHLNYSTTMCKKVEEIKPIDSNHFAWAV